MFLRAFFFCWLLPLEVGMTCVFATLFLAYLSEASNQSLISSSAGSLSSRSILACSAPVENRFGRQVEANPVNDPKGRLVEKHVASPVA